MAKRKAKRVKKKFVPLRADKKFSCLECHREQMVECRLDYQRDKGRARCGACECVFVCDINKLSQPIDVYSEWVDSKAQRRKEE